jgi:hypothetical protein
VPFFSRIIFLSWKNVPLQRQLIMLGSDKPLGHNALAAEASFKRIRQCACAVRWKFRNPEPPIDLFPEEPALYKSQGMTDFLQPKRVSRPIATRVWFHEDCLTGQRALDGSSV